MGQITYNYPAMLATAGEMHGHNAQLRTVGTGIAGVGGNKGGVAARTHCVGVFVLACVLSAFTCVAHKLGAWAAQV